jgi:hypothetical protein
MNARRYGKRSAADIGQQASCATATAADGSRTIRRSTAAACNDQVFDIDGPQELKRSAAGKDVGDVVFTAVSVGHRLDDIAARVLGDGSERLCAAGNRPQESRVHRHSSNRPYSGEETPVSGCL